YPTRSAMMVTTTSSSRSVKPVRRPRARERVFMAWTESVSITSPGCRNYARRGPSPGSAFQRFPLVLPIAYAVLSPGVVHRARLLNRSPCGSRNLDRVGGLANLRGIPIDDQPLPRCQNADVVPAQQAVGAHVVPPGNAVDGFALAHDVDRPAPARGGLG